MLIIVLQISSLWGVRSTITVVILPSFSKNGKILLKTTENINGLFGKLRTFLYWLILSGALESLVPRPHPPNRFLFLLSGTKTQKNVSLTETFQRLLCLSKTIFLPRHLLRPISPHHPPCNFSFLLFPLL